MSVSHWPDGIFDLETSHVLPALIRKFHLAKLARTGVDPTQPDGTPQKLLDVSRLADLGWRASIELAEGLKTTYAWYGAESAGARRKAKGARRKAQGERRKAKTSR